MMKYTKVALVVIALLPCLAYAHGGGLDKHGCHTNRKTGDYHCHHGGGGQSAAALSLAPRTAEPKASLASSSTNRTVAYANCAEARAAGAAPVRIGEPGYGAHLDRDGDGVGCEPYRGRR